MVYKSIEIFGQTYQWSSVQDSQHPDFVLVCEGGKIWVQVGDSYDQIHNDAYLDGKEEFPISDKTAQRIITEIVENGYLETYFKTDVGLILYSDEGLQEN